MDAKGAISTGLTLGITYVVIGAAVACYARLVCDQNSDGKVTEEEYDAMVGAGVYRLFGPITGVMKTLFRSFWPFDEVGAEA